MNSKLKPEMTIKYIVLVVLLIVISGLIFFQKNRDLLAKEALTEQPFNFYNIKIKTLSGKILELTDFKNKIVLVVNVASNCGFTNQYKDLEALYQQFKLEEFVILGVPSNDFGGQEPGSAEDIQSFCRLNYGVSFPMAEKVKIKGNQQHELYCFLTQSNPKYNGNVKWNFTKFLIDKNGQVVDRFSPVTEPLSKKVVGRITKLIK